jgi:sugar lactone lactonase YvrE
VEVAFLEDTTHLHYPLGVGADGTNIWIADSRGLRALKFQNDGTFLMQIGKNGFRYGATTAISFNQIGDISVDSSGNIWITDLSVSQVFKFNSSGTYVSALGTAWSRGTANNQFNYPRGAAFDSAGNIYVSDTSNHRIQVFNSSGTYLATLGAPGTAGSGSYQFNQPRHIAIYADYLYVADAYNHRVQIFDVTSPAAITYVATIGVTGSSGSDNTRLNWPQGVAVDANKIYVADANNFRVQIFDRTTRVYQSTLGAGTAGTGNNQFALPRDVEVDSAGNIYVADETNQRVQQFDSGLTYVRTYGTTGVPYLTDGSHYNQPSGIAIASDGSIYLTEAVGQRLLKLNSTGVLQWSVGEPGVSGSNNTHFDYPNDVDLDSAGRVYVPDGYNNRVQIFNADSSYAATLGTGLGTGPYQFNYPMGVAIDTANNIYVADTNNHRIQVYDSSRNYVTTIGTGISGSSNSQFNSPYDVAVDSARNIYVADRANHRVQVFNSSFAYVRTLGVTGSSGSNFDRFSNPIAVAVDAVGRIYVSDQWGGRIMVFDSTGAFLTNIGNSGGNRTGQMRQVEGLAFDSMGNLYLADLLNHRVTKHAVGVPGWLQSNLDGFGDRTNTNIHTLASFGGRLYAGTYNSAGNGAQMWRTGSNWTAAITPGFGITRNIGINHLLPFNSQLYAGVRNDTTGASVYRSSDGSTWNPVETGGFGDPNTSGVYRFAVFNNQIYAGTSIFTTTHGAEIWRSPSGDSGTWERVVANGFDHRNHCIIRTSEVHNGYLYFGTQNVDTSTYMTTTGGIVIRSNTGNNGEWTKVMTEGFGNINNAAISGLASFNGYLYASTSRWDWAGIEVWRCQTCDSPGSWQKVVDNGFGNRDNWGISTLQIFNSQLYLVTGSGTGIEVWRSSTGNSGEWMQVHAGGFGNSNNASPYYNNVTVFNNALYIGTNNSANGAQVWQMLNQLYLPLILR